MNFGILGFIGLIGLGIGGAVTAMDVAEQNRLAQDQAPTVEVQPVQDVAPAD
jgi:hypothetical protein